MIPVRVTSSVAFGIMPVIRMSIWYFSIASSALAAPPRSRSESPAGAEAGASVGATVGVAAGTLAGAADGSLGAVVGAVEPQAAITSVAAASRLSRRVVRVMEGPPRVDECARRIAPPPGPGLASGQPAGGSTGPVASATSPIPAGGTAISTSAAGGTGSTPERRPSRTDVP